MSTYSVVPLTGGRMGNDDVNLPDWHVVDERGRTVAVFRSERMVTVIGATRRQYRGRTLAENHAAMLNRMGAQTVQGSRSHYAVIVDPL